MGSFFSCFDSPVLTALQTMSWEQVLYAWEKSTVILPKGATVMNRLQFIAIFTDRRRIKDGIYFELPLHVFKMLDFNLCNEVNVNMVFLLAALFPRIGTGSNDSRFKWIACNICRRRDATGLVDEANLTIQELSALINTLHSAFYYLNCIYRQPETGEMMALTSEVAVAVAGNAHNGVIPIYKLVRWAQTESAVHLLLSRFQLSLHSYERAAGGIGSLPQLIAIDPMFAADFDNSVASPPAAFKKNALDKETAKKDKKPINSPSLMSPRSTLKDLEAEVAGPSNTETLTDVEILRRSVAKAVTGRQVLEELQRKTRLTIRELGNLKAEFAKAANIAGVLDKAAFIKVIQAQFPILDGSTIERLFTSFDTDNSGSISFREFVKGAARMTKGKLDEKLDFLWSIICDKNESVIRVRDLLKFVTDGQAELEALYTSTKERVINILSQQRQKKHYDDQDYQYYMQDTSVTSVISMEEFVNAMVDDPSVTTWLASISRTTSLRNLAATISQLATLLSETAEDAKATNKRSNWKKIQQDRLKKATEAIEGTKLEQGRSGLVATPGPFSFKALMTSWRTRMETIRMQDGNGGKLHMLPMSDEFLQRFFTDVNEAYVYTDQNVTLDTFPRFLAGCFGVPITGSVRGINAAARNMFEALVSAAKSLNRAQDGMQPAPTFTDEEGFPKREPVRRYSIQESLPTRSHELPSAAVWNADDADILLEEYALPTTLCMSVIGMVMAHDSSQLCCVLYRQADMDGDGNVRLGEISRFIFAQMKLASTPLTAAQTILISLDGDGDGTISHSEFKTGLMRKPALLDTFAIILGHGGENNAETRPPSAVEPHSLSTRMYSSTNGFLENEVTGLNLPGEDKIRDSPTRLSTRLGRGGVLQNPLNEARSPKVNMTGEVGNNATSAAFPRLTIWNVDPRKQEASASFAGIHLWGIGDEDENSDKRKPKKESEAIEIRRRKLLSAARTITADISRTSNELATVSDKLRYDLHLRQEAFRKQVQKSIQAGREADLLIRASEKLTNSSLQQAKESATKIVRPKTSDARTRPRTPATRESTWNPHVWKTYKETNERKSNTQSTS